MGFRAVFDVSYAKTTPSNLPRHQHVADVGA